MIVLQGKLSVAAAKILSPVLGALSKQCETLGIIAMTDKMTFFARDPYRAACMRAVFHSRIFDTYSASPLDIEEPETLNFADRWDESSANVTRVYSKRLDEAFKQFSDDPSLQDVTIVIDKCSPNDPPDDAPSWLKHERHYSGSSLFVRFSLGYGVVTTHRLDVLRHEESILVPRGLDGAALGSSPHVIVCSVVARTITSQLAPFSTRRDGVFTMSFKPDFITVEGSSNKLRLSKELQFMGDVLYAYQPQDAIVTFHGYIGHIFAMMDVAAELSQNMAWSYRTPPKLLRLSVPAKSSPDWEELCWFVEMFVPVSEGPPSLGNSPSRLAARERVCEVPSPHRSRRRHAADKENDIIDNRHMPSQNQLHLSKGTEMGSHEAAALSNAVDVTISGQEDFDDRLPMVSPAAKRRRLTETLHQAPQSSDKLPTVRSGALPGCGRMNETARSDSQMRLEHFELIEGTSAPGGLEGTQTTTLNSAAADATSRSLPSPVVTFSPLVMYASQQLLSSSSSLGGSQPTAGPARRSLKKDAVPFSSLISLDDLPDDLPDGGFLPLLHSSLDSAHSSLSHVTSEPSHVQPLYHFSSANASLPAVYASLDDEAEDLNQNKDD